MADSRLDRIERLLEQAGRRIDSLGIAFGRFAEGLVAPSLKRLLRRFDVEQAGYALRATEHRNGDTMEVDVLSHGRRREKPVVVAVEVKSFLQATDVNDWLKELERFHEFFPLYRDHDLIGAVAGITFEYGAAKHAERCGLIVIGASEDVAEALNRQSFRPKVWPAPRRGRRSAE
jgi:hypothetical protein